MDEKELKQKFSELKNLSEWELGHFSASIFLYTLLGDERAGKKFIVESIQNTANALGAIINYSQFANAFFLQLNDALEAINSGEELKDVRKKIEENFGEWGAAKKFF